MAGERDEVLSELDLELRKEVRAAEQNDWEQLREPWLAERELAGLRTNRKVVLGDERHRAARPRPGHDLAEWEPEWQAAERLGSGVVPDGRVVYATETYEVSAFVEADLGTERPSRFAEKIASYLEAYRAGRWRERLPAWPLVLTVTTTATRATALRRATEDVLERQRDRERLAATIEFDFAPLPDLQGPAGPLGRIWQTAGIPGLHALIPVEALTKPSAPTGASDE